MGTKKTTWPRRPAPSFRKRLSVYERRGQLIAAAWPRPRGPNRPAIQKWWSEWLRQADLLWQICPQGFKDAAALASAGSPQMPRDLFIAATRGRLWYYTTTEGVSVYPMAAAEDVSKSLDVLAQFPGSMLVRGERLWTFVTAGVNDGDVLSWNALTGLPEWREAPSPGGEVYTPPLAADFPTWINQLTAACSNAPTGPLVMGRPNVIAFPNLTARVRPLLTPPRKYRIAIRALMGAANDQSGGLCIQDAGTGRLMTFGFHKVTGINCVRWSIQRWTSPTVWSAQMYFGQLIEVGAAFLELSDDGVNFDFRWSADDAEFQSVQTDPRTIWLANPTHWGFYFANRAGESDPSNIAVFHWREI